MESADAIDDSDEEADYTKMDQGNKKGPVGRWDFDTQEEYSSYMSSREALPKWVYKQYFFFSLFFFTGAWKRVFVSQNMPKEMLSSLGINLFFFWFLHFFVYVIIFMNITSRWVRLASFIAQWVRASQYNGLLKYSKRQQLK